MSKMKVNNSGDKRMRACLSFMATVKSATVIENVFYIYFKSLLSMQSLDAVK